MNPWTECRGSVLITIQGNVPHADAVTDRQALSGPGEGRRELATDETCEISNAGIGIGLKTAKGLGGAENGVEDSPGGSGKKGKSAAPSPCSIVRLLEYSLRRLLGEIPVSAIGRGTGKMGRRHWLSGESIVHAYACKMIPISRWSHVLCCCV